MQNMEVIEFSVLPCHSNAVILPAAKSSQGCSLICNGNVLLNLYEVLKFSHNLIT